MDRVLLLIHLVAVIVWLGGMFFAHFCLRPVAAAMLPPPERLALLASVLARFFAVISWALLLLWGSGMARFAEVGAAAPGHWRVMAGIAAVMTVIFGMIGLRFHPRMVAAVAGKNWPEAAAAMNSIRQLVMINLALGFITVAVAMLGG